MSSFLWLLLFVGGALALAYRRVGLRQATIVTGIALAAYTMFGDGAFVWLTLLWVGFAGLAALTPHDVLDAAMMRNLHFCQSRQVGSIFHMLRALGTEGQLGVTSVGNSPEEAQRQFEKVVAALTDEVAAATAGT